MSLVVITSIFGQVGINTDALKDGHAKRIGLTSKLTKKKEKLLVLKPL